MLNFVARNHLLHSKAHHPAIIEDALEAAISAVRSDVAPNDWVLCGFEGSDDVQLIGTGTGGIEVTTVQRVCVGWIPVRVDYRITVLIAVMQVSN